MSKVYMFQRPVPNASGWTPDMGPATQYGPLRFIFEPSDAVWRNTEAAKAKALIALKEFDPEKDFLCWTSAGDPSTMWLVVQVLATLRVTKLQYLYYQRPHGERSAHYIPIQIDTTDLLPPKNPNLKNHEHQPH